MNRILLAVAGLLGGCATDEEPDDNDDGAAPEDCVYPDARQAMALDEPLFPYRWLDARHRDGREAPVRMREAHCNTSEDIDWSPFDVLVFVSIPAW